MREVLETELLGYCLAPLGEAGAALADKLDDEEAESIRRALAGLLAEEASRGEVCLVGMSAIEVPAHKDLKSILYRDTGVGGTRKIAAFGFRDAAVETWLPLLGIAIAVFTGRWGISSAATAGGVLKTLWSKLVVLKRPADADAIDTLEAVTRIRARWVADGGKAYPSNADLEREMDLAPEAIERALKRLKASSIIEVVSWGGQKEDLAHPGNQWRVRL
jgi:hypothetical protein